MTLQGEAEVESWIEGLAMGQYVPAFVSNHIKGSVLLLLTQPVLQDHLGITSEFHSRYLATEIKLLRESSIGLDCPIPASVDKENPELIGASADWDTEQGLCLLLFFS